MSFQRTHGPTVWCTFLLATLLSGSGCARWRMEPADIRGANALDSTKVYRATLTSGETVTVRRPQATDDSIIWLVPNLDRSIFPATGREAIAWEDVRALRVRKVGVLATLGMAGIAYLAAAVVYALGGGGGCC